MSYIALRFDADADVALQWTDALMAAGAPHFPVSELSGLAVMQSTTGVVGGVLGLPAVLLFMAATLIVGTIVFLMYT